MPSAGTRDEQRRTTIRTLRARLHSESGFTLIELLVVIIILGILLAIAIPSYLAFKGRAQTSAAEENVRSAVPGIEAYAADHDGYSGATSAVLQQSYDAGIKHITIKSVTATTYCMESTVGPVTYMKAGPAADITKGSCP